MDMWEPYANSVRAHLVDADDKIVFDRFHVMGYLGKAVDTVRKKENRTLVAEGDKSLTGSKYLWLYSAENLPRRHRGRFAALRNADLKTGEGVGDQGDPPSLLGVQAQRMGRAPLEELVLLGDALPPRAGHRSGIHTQAPP
jgi:transposase